MKFILNLLLFITLFFTDSLLAFNSTIQSGIYGINFKDSLLSNISSSTSSYLFNKAGDIGVVTNSKEYYKKQTNKAITDKEAMDLLLLSAK
ncbi:hypothetical protein [Campylobacter ureolyticus]|uniref:hypothetical protein n=1 Tax=Campylobacter ureolyticus TaxID=827 RepID=UPI001FC7E17C|nr:hypothetical protein [Campylobacter ureolyticus]MDU7070456.1 hypothetical protein [Campylobacter ureolyticus]GKH61530.1 hypothetical protein CE91St25_18660 [Campylobacter ureolyticus]